MEGYRPTEDRGLEMQNLTEVRSRGSATHRCKAATSPQVRGGVMARLPELPGCECLRDV